MVSNEYWVQLQAIQELRGPGELVTWPEGLGRIVKAWDLDRMIGGAKIVRGMLVLTPQYLLFFEKMERGHDKTWLYGAISWGCSLSVIHSIEVQSYFMLQEQIVIRFLKDIATFNVGAGIQSNEIRRLILSYQQLAKPPSQSPVTHQARGLDALLVGVVQAYRGMPVIPFEEFYSVTQGKEEKKVSKAMVRRQLVELLGAGRIAGQLTPKGFKREVVGIVQCQVCDRAELDPPVYWQCPECYRKVCTSCRSTHTQCPSHPEVPTALVKLPAHCTHCHAVVGELRAVTDLLCQQCGTPLQF